MQTLNYMCFLLVCCVRRQASISISILNRNLNWRSKAAPSVRVSLAPFELLLLLLLPHVHVCMCMLPVELGSIYVWGIISIIIMCLHRLDLFVSAAAALTH